MQISNAETGTIQTPSGARHVTVLSIEESTAKAPSGVHHMLVCDCSTSMTSSLPQLRQSAVEFVSHLKPEEKVSIIIFSGHHQAHTILWPTACNAAGKDQAIRAIYGRVRPIGTTVFSEPLNQALDFVQYLSGDVVTSLTLLTDGCPVPTQWTVNEEKRRAFNAVAHLQKAGFIVNLIGYGVHYDPLFLYELDEHAGFNGMRCHISEIEEWHETVKEIRAMVERATLTMIELEVRPAAIRIYKSSPQISVFEGSMVGLNVLDSGVATLWLETSKPLDSLMVTGRVNGKEFTLQPKLGTLSPENIKEFRRTAAAWLFTKGKVADAVSLLRDNSDDLLADRAAHAYTERERRETADLLGRRVFRDRKFIGEGIKPSGPSHCVLNALRILIEDAENVVYIPKGAYKRITELTVDPRIVESSLGRVLQVRRLTSNDERFNFSLLCLVDVKVKPEDITGPLVAAQVWRNYTIIKDGNLHLEELEASLSKKSFDKLQEAGVIAKNEMYRSGKAFTINFRGLRMISNAWANPRTLGLVPLMQEEADLAAEQTGLNTRLKELRHERPEFEGNIYHPTTKKEEGPYEVYMAPCCEYRLMNYKPKNVDCSSMTASEAYSRVREVRARLAVVRYIIRSIIFAMEAVNSAVIHWGQAKHTKRGQWPKSEQLATFDGTQLKRVMWEEQVACS